MGELKKLLRKSLQRFSRDNALMLSAALSFYFIISIIPLFIISIIILSFFLETTSVLNSFLLFIYQLGGEQLTRSVVFILTSSLQRDSNISLFGLIMFILGATALLNHLRFSLNRIWGVEEEKVSVKKKIKGEFKKRINSLLTIFLSGILFIAFVISSSILFFIGNVRILPIPLWMNILLLYVANYILLFVFITAFFSIIYRIIPDQDLGFRTVVPGALLTSFLFIIGQVIISLYLQFSSVGTLYGTSGTIILLLIWFYYSSAIFFFGAEFTKVYSERRKK